MATRTTCRGFCGRWCRIRLRKRRARFQTFSRRFFIKAPFTPRRFRRFRFCENCGLPRSEGSQGSPLVFNRLRRIHKQRLVENAALSAARHRHESFRVAMPRGVVGGARRGCGCKCHRRLVAGVARVGGASHAGVFADSAKNRRDVAQAARRGNGRQGEGRDYPRARGGGRVVESGTRGAAKKERAVRRVCDRLESRAIGRGD